jgi:hypothetical protein
MLAIALCVVALADLWYYGQKMVRLEPTSPAPLWTEAAQVIGQTEERVIPWGVSIFEQNGAAMVGLKSVFAYNSLSLAAIDALTGSVPDPRSTAYDLLSAGYVISGVPLDNFREGERGLTLIHNSENAWIYRRGRTMPAVRLVSAVEVIPDDAAAIARIHDPGFDPANTVLLATMPDCLSAAAASGGNGSAQLLEHAPAYWRIETRSSTPAVLVVSESAYPGWHVTIDGEAARAYTAYTALRAVCVPAGAHVVEWKFAPTIYYAGLAGTTLTLVVCLWAIWRHLTDSKP